MKALQRKSAWPSSGRNGSILDFITERTRALQQELGPGDKVLLDGYLDTVREIERRVQLAQNRDLSGVKAPEIPQAEQDTAIDKEVRLLFDLIAIAYQADLTRVASYIMIGEGTNRTYNHIGVPELLPSAVTSCRLSRSA